MRISVAATTVLIVDPSRLALTGHAPEAAVNQPTCQIAAVKTKHIGKGFTMVAVQQVVELPKSRACLLFVQRW